MPATGSLSADERRTQIMELMTGNEMISAAEMAGQLHVSTKTIKRDIQFLKQATKIEKTGSGKSGRWNIK